MKTQDHSGHYTEQLSMKGMKVVIFSDFAAFHHTNERRLTDRCGVRKHTPQQCAHTHTLSLSSSQNPRIQRPPAFLYLHPRNLQLSLQNGSFQTQALKTDQGPFCQCFVKPKGKRVDPGPRIWRIAGNHIADQPPTEKSYNELLTSYLRSTLPC